MMNSLLSFTSRNIAWFKQANDKQELEMAPPFQRNPVWTDKQKSYLIDTILNGYPVPEIYMQEDVDSEGKAQYIIVDGQQRVRSCLDFINGEFSIDSKETPKWGDLYFEDLNDVDKKKIYQYNLIIRMLPTLPEIEIRAIFGRLNRNVVALNQQELRQATYWGPFIVLINAISDWEVWSKLDVFTANDIRRMLDAEFISELAIAYMHGLQNKKINLDKYYRIYEEKFDRKSEVEQAFLLVTSEIYKIFPDIGSYRWSKKTDFYTLFVVIAQNKEKFPINKAKSEYIREILIKFGSYIDTGVSKVEQEENTGQYDLFGSIPAGKSDENLINVKSIADYVSGIRASTDLGSRKMRHDALWSVIEPLLAVE